MIRLDFISFIISDQAKEYSLCFQVLKNVSSETVSLNLQWICLRVTYLIIILCSYHDTLDQKKIIKVHQQPWSVAYVPFSECLLSYATTSRQKQAYAETETFISLSTVTFNAAVSSCKETMSKDNLTNSVISTENSSN